MADTENTDDSDATRDDETPQEAEQAAETGETPEEAHRAGEFDALSAKLDSILERLNAVSALLTSKAVDEPVNAPENTGSEDERLVSLDDIDFND